MSDIIMHKATSMSSILCGMPTNIANVGWTNDESHVTCDDCKTIMEIQRRNSATTKAVFDE